LTRRVTISLLISKFRLVLNVVFFLMGDSDTEGVVETGWNVVL